ncbi:MAG: alkaline phosphatase D family protein [Planctomycetes bacterium]|nr:alkaline phosphatase D family protein [Planctomycetota bacterium]
MPLLRSGIRNMLAIGHVAHDRARIWICVERPGPYELNWWPSDANRPKSSTHLLAIDDDATDNTTTCVLPGLRSDTEYGIELRDSFGVRIAHGRFRTSPASWMEKTGEPFSIAVMSCYQPFRADGTVDPMSERMLECAHAAMKANNTRLALLLGDQLYSDAPSADSLFADDSIFSLERDAVRALYQRRYRRFWNVPAWKRIQAEWPCYPIPDDHDVIDNFGSSPDHGSRKWQHVRDGALAAFCDYQASRMGSEPRDMADGYHFEFDHGPVAGFAMDLRSCRQVGTNGSNHLISAHQLEDLERCLERHGDKPVFVLGMSLPLHHVPRPISWLGGLLTSRGDDFTDRLSHPYWKHDRERIVETLVRHRLARPKQRFVIVSGDIHIGAVMKLEIRSRGVVLDQLISSPIANHERFLVNFAARLSLIRHSCTIGSGDAATISRVVPAAKPMQNPYNGLNIGFIEVSGNWSDPEVRLSLYGDRDGSPFCVYRSEPL